MPLPQDYALYVQFSCRGQEQPNPRKQNISSNRPGTPADEGKTQPEHQACVTRMRTRPLLSALSQTGWEPRRAWHVSDDETRALLATYGKRRLHGSRGLR